MRRTLPMKLAAEIGWIDLILGLRSVDGSTSKDRGRLQPVPNLEGKCSQGNTQYAAESTRNEASYCRLAAGSEQLEELKGAGISNDDGIQFICTYRLSCGNDREDA